MLTSFIRSLFCCCLLAVLVSSCGGSGSSTDPRIEQEKLRQAAAKNEEIRRSKVEAQREQNMAALVSINQRIQIYQQKSVEWREAQTRLDSNQITVEGASLANSCQMQLTDLLGGYLDLQQRLTNGQSAAEGPAAEALLRLNQQDMAFLEGQCNSLLTEIQTAEFPDPSGDSSLTSIQESPEIRQAFERSDYPQVLNLYNRQNQDPAQPPAGATTLLYAQALIKNYQDEMARSTLQDLLEQTQFETGQSGVYIHALRLLADLDFAAGSYEKAKENYERLVRIAVQGSGRDEWATVQLTALQPEGMGFEEAKEYSQLLKSYLAYTPKRDGYAVSGIAESFLLNYPASRLVPNANQIHRLNRQQAENWLNRELQGVQNRVDQRGQTGGPGTGNASSSGQADQLDSLLRDKYDKATALLAEQSYDQAIAGFQDLLGTSYQDQARSGIEEASKLAAEDARKQAAELFVRAANTNNPESKKKLLNSSRELLQGILDKYPQSGLTNKVRRNLESIDRDLRSMGAMPY